ncbi:STAS domain-containing protein [Lysobacter alkalisoli]|uniref:STAS domain-containing protein n=2 Tax=Marilutibacter alkalisoli TaxID=2591633 RepID=A0A514BW35_9GAMM|nr:STAS domain-containing protein [Lysobacter alkalisoli]
MTAASVRRDGDTLMFAGELGRDACASAWTQARPLLAGTRRLDLTAVTRVDSAGLALLAEIAEQAGIDRGAGGVAGDPAGLSELRAAYRMDANLTYAG